jgi:hypothetical protein
MECFNCFKQGFCGYGVKSTSGNILRFCSHECAQVQRTDNALYVATNALNVANEVFEMMNSRQKTDQFTVPARKIVFTQRLLLNSIIARKSKTELNRLSDMIKDQLSDMLTLIGDTCLENTLLIFAERMKVFYEQGTNLIEILGS